MCERGVEAGERERERERGEGGREGEMKRRESR